MSYIKHNGNYYKKIDLKDLSKDELIELISEAVEVKTKVIHEHTYGGWYTKPIWQPYLSYSDGYSITSVGSGSSSGSVSLNKKALSQLNVNSLVSLANSID